MKTGRIPLSIIAIIILTSNFLMAQWIPTNGPYCGGSVGFLTVSGNILLAGVEAPQVSSPNLVPSRIFESTDNGRTWNPVYTAGTETSFTSILSVGHDLFVSAGDRILKSTNNGLSWFEPDTNMRKIKIKSLAKISISGKTSIYAVSWDKRGLFVSIDGGRNWRLADSAFGNIMALVGWGHKLYAGTDSGIFISTNMGVSWHEGGLKYYRIEELSVMENSAIFAQTNEGLFYSTDEGKDWLVTNKPGRGQFARSFAIVGRKIFMSYSGKLFVSNDKGQTWLLLNNEIQNIDVLCSDGKYMFADSWQNGFYRSSDGGKTWEVTNNGLMKAGIFHLAMSGKYLYAGTKGYGVFRSTDDGKEWIPLDFTVRSNFKDYVTALEAHDSSICARTWSGLYNSTDNGAAWLRSDIRDRQGRGFAASLAVKDSDIFAGTKEGLLHSTNGGKTWAWSDSGLSLSSGYAQMPIPTPGITTKSGREKIVLAVPPPRPSTGSKKLREVQALTFKGMEIFAGVTGGDIFVSRDDGVLWTQVDSNLTSSEFNELTAIDSNLFALMEGNGVFRSSDDGRTWKQINDGLADQDAHVLVHKGKNLFAGVGSGVCFSNDDGDHWTIINSGLKDSVIIGLSISGDYLYAGTWDYGVWSRSISEIIDSASNSAIRKEK